ncbi:MAG: D-2-hydroxyacid dehydrogenase [Rhizobiales bacterium]|nr:D-2-hydroxyacid dehydrogenase [Hyphomicrobiales bacterium]
MAVERIVFLDRGSLRAPIRAPRFPHEWKDYEYTESADALGRLKGASIAILNKVPLRRSELAELPDLRLIAIAATGSDVIDLKACNDLGIAVSNIRAYAVNSLPEHVFALILALSRSLNWHKQSVETGAWTNSKTFCVFTNPMRDLAGSTLGLIGFGALGRSVAALGKAFKMSVIAYDQMPVKEPGVRPAALDEIIEQSDVISLHVPLTDATRNMIGASALGRMKRHAIIINTARGGLIDEQALADALANGRIGGAGLDVLSVEPPPTEHPLLKLRHHNLIVTPHMAWASEEAMRTLSDQLIDNIEAFIAGMPQNLLTQTSKI